MKRILTVGLVFVLLFCEVCFAVGFDLENMSSSELQELKNMIDDELNANHEASSEQKDAVETAIEGYVESIYGADNVSWAWIDYTYSREWDFFTMKTHADILKQDGGKAEYDIYGEVIVDGSDYTVIYVEVGTEVLLDERNSKINDQRILLLLGIEGQNEEVVAEDIKDEQDVASEEVEVVIVAQKGDKNDTVKSIQEMLIRLEYLSGSADGDFGGKTEKAVLSFQKDNGLTEDGVVSQEVFDALSVAFAEAPIPVEYPHFTAVELYKKFEDNQISAEAELEGVEIQVTGTIESISESIWGTPYVSLKADSYGLSTIQCYFSKDMKSELADLKAGNKATIQGTCGTMGFMNVEMDDCKLIK